MTESTRLKSTIYVGGLDAAVTASTLHAAFIPFGDISSITLPKPELPSEQARSPHRGFGYVEFEDAADASEAMDNMDHAELFGRVIRVAPAKPAKDPNEGLGSKTAVWEQEGWLSKHAVSDEDRRAAEEARVAALSAAAGAPVDPMQGLEELDVAGPRPERAQK